jgi:hypothetical protein
MGQIPLDKAAAAWQASAHRLSAAEHSKEPFTHAGRLVQVRLADNDLPLDPSEKLQSQASEAVNTLVYGNSSVFDARLKTTTVYGDTHEETVGIGNTSNSPDSYHGLSHRPSEDNARGIPISKAIIGARTRNTASAMCRENPEYLAQMEFDYDIWHKNRMTGQDSLEPEMVKMSCNAPAAHYSHKEHATKNKNLSNTR